MTTLSAGLSQALDLWLDPSFLPLRSHLSAASCETQLRATLLEVPANEGYTSHIAALTINGHIS